MLGMYKSQGERRTSWIRGKINAENILLTIKKKKGSCAGHVVRRSENRWTSRVTELQPRNYTGVRGD